MPNSISWQQLLNNIEQVVNSINEPNQIDQHKQFLLDKLAKYQANDSDFKRFEHYDEQAFTKNLVVEFGNICNVIIMCWAPSQSSSIHGHNGSKCFVKILKGNLREQRFTRPSLTEPSVRVDLSKQPTSLNKNEVTYIDDDLGAHKVANNSQLEAAVSMHVYVPAYKTSQVYTPLDHEDGQSKLSLDQCRPVDLVFRNQAQA